MAHATSYVEPREPIESFDLPDFPEPDIPIIDGFPESNHISNAPSEITWILVSSPGPDDEERIINSIQRGFDIWEEHNQSLNFTRISDHEYTADINVHWAS